MTDETPTPDYDDVEGLNRTMKLLRGILMDAWDQGATDAVAGRVVVRVHCEEPIYDVFTGDAEEYLDTLNVANYDSAKQLRATLFGYPFDYYDRENWESSDPPPAPDEEGGGGREFY